MVMSIPSRYYDPADYPAYLVSLAGTFADATGAIVGTPFRIGDFQSVTVPVGATQLQLGIDDSKYQDNDGTFVVMITGSASTRAVRVDPRRDWCSCRGRFRMAPSAPIGALIAPAPPLRWRIRPRFDIVPLFAAAGGTQQSTRYGQGDEIRTEVAGSAWLAASSLDSSRKHRYKTRFTAA